MLLEAWTGQPANTSRPYFPLQLNAHHLHTATDDRNCNILVIRYLYSISLQGNEMEKYVCVCLQVSITEGPIHL